MAGDWQDARSLIDPLARPTYWAIAAGFGFSLLVLLVMGFQADAEAASVFLVWPFVAVGGMLARRINAFRLSDLLQGIALIYGQGLCLLFLLYGAAAAGGPLADRWLAAIDEAMGFYWPNYVAATLPYRWPLTLAYKSFAWQPLLLVVVLLAAGRRDRMWTLLLAAIVASAITCLIFLFAPAYGVFNHYGLTLSGMVKNGTYEFHEALTYFRDGGRIISPKVMTGLVSFPSYHTAEVVLFIWAGWSVKWVRWPLLALNVAVLVSVPVIGAHYLVDMLGGLLVAVVAIVIAKRIMRDRVAAWWAFRQADAPMADPSAPRKN